MIKKILFTSFFLLIVILLGMFLLFKYQTTGQCSRFDEIAKRQDVQLTLEQWVSTNVDSNKITLADLERSSGIYPGNYSLKRKFDWSLLNIDPQKGQVKIIVGRNEKGEFDFSNIQSVSFTDRSRVSILVRTSISNSYGIRDKEHIRPITASVAVYCAW
jgi:hypothetical protein